MKAYLVADVVVTDAAGQTAVLEGDLSPCRVIILEFPSMARLRAWYDSPEYRPLRVLRERTARTTLLAIEGV